MVKQDLVNYIRRGVNSGHQISTLKKELVNEGWPHDLVDQAASEVRQDPAHSKQLFKNNISGAKENIQSDKKNVPTGVKVVAISHFIIALGVIFVQTLKGIAATSIFGNMFAENIVLFSFIIAIMLSVIPIIIGIKIIKGKNWARIAAIVIGLTVILSEMYSLFVRPNVFGISHLLLSIFIVIYLLINIKGKEYFR